MFVFFLNAFISKKLKKLLSKFPASHESILPSISLWHLLYILEGHAWLHSRLPFPSTTDGNRIFQHLPLQKTGKGS